MLTRVLPIAILAAIALLTAAAIEYLPETLYYPVVEYSMPGDVQIAMLKNGELDIPRCKRSVSQVARTVRASCPDCKYAERCVRGLDAERKKILSREPLATPSLRMQNGTLTVTVSAKNPDFALTVCRLVAEQTATQTAGRNLLCFPPLTSR